MFLSFLESLSTLGVFQSFHPVRNASIWAVSVKSNRVPDVFGRKLVLLRSQDDGTDRTVHMYAQITLWTDLLSDVQDTMRQATNIPAFHLTFDLRVHMRPAGLGRNFRCWQQRSKFAPNFPPETVNMRRSPLSFFCKLLRRSKTTTGINNRSLIAARRPAASRKLKLSAPHGVNQTGKCSSCKVESDVTLQVFGLWPRATWGLAVNSVAKQPSSNDSNSKG